MIEMEKCALCGGESKSNGGCDRWCSNPKCYLGKIVTFEDHWNALQRAILAKVEDAVSQHVLDISQKCPERTCYWVQKAESLETRIREDVHTQFFGSIDYPTD